MMLWFEDEASTIRWAGPNFRYPYTIETFSADLNLDKLSSWGLLNDVGGVMAFGQFYLRLEKCHLGRLVVNPHFRGGGVGSDLIQLLGTQGRAELGVQDCSLFVLESNLIALKLYRSSGFVAQDYPDEMPLEKCLYMVRPGGISDN